MSDPPVAVQHIVLFRFPHPLSDDDVDAMRRQIRGWIGTIDGLRRVRFGADVSGRSQGHQVGLLTEFDSAEQLEAYFPHPAHQSFARWVAHRECVVLAFDHPLTDETVLLEPPGG